MPHALEIQIAGESLFNDGIGVVAFIVLSEIAIAGEHASAAHIVSGPIAVVVAGFFIGNHGRRFVMSETTRENLDAFWALID